MRLILCALLLWDIVLSINVQGNGYKDVIVSIHPDVSEENGQKIIDNIKTFITRGSNELFFALEKYRYIESVTILLPKTWKNHFGGSVSTDYFYEDGNFRVNLPNPLYQDAPYTLQPRGCGDRGEYIHLTPDFLIHLNDSSTDTFGPLEKVFVHEWSKFRYGVFEEYGFPGDDQYPLFFYAQEFTDNGIVNDLQPNFCTDVLLSGSRVDNVTGGSCNFDPQTNLPDENCIFIPSGDNSNVKSSYMAAPFLKSVDHFCKPSEAQLHHDIFKPTKHNAMCDYKSVWEVIMQNSDFSNIKPMDLETPPNTKFTIVHPGESGRFVLVADRSTSMGSAKRIEKLKQSAIRWVRYDLTEGTKVGLTSFCEVTTINKPLTTLTNGNREDFVSVIQSLKLQSGTCLGNGLMNGMDALNGVNNENQGGAIIFITDGEYSCHDTHPAYDIDDATVENRIRLTKVRIITVAFGANSDERLEHLAEISGGKTYFVKDDDSGLEDINGVFDESNTYQPAVPSSDAEIIITQDTFRQIRNDVLDDFIIDKTLGRDVKFTLDVLSRKSNVIESVTIFFPNGTVLHKFNDEIEDTISTTFDFLEPGVYEYKVDVKSEVEYLLITISSKAQNNETLPFRTKCWASTDGSGEIDAKLTKLAVLAKVEQGNRPVLHANVEALVERENEPAPIRVDLFDNGGGSDQVANDGIYSRYFTQYDEFDGRYTLRCQVKGTDDTMFVTQKNGAKSVTEYTRRTYPLQPSYSPVCCGSSIGQNINTEATGNFTRKANGNSFKVKNAPKKDEDFFPPSKVSNLKVTLETQALIEFTAPGDDYDYGNATRYEFKYSQDYDKIMNASFDWDAQKDILNITDDDLIGDDATLTPGIGGEQESFFINPDLFEEGNVYYLAMKAFDDKDQDSPMSNIVRIVKISYDDGGLSGGQIAGIVIGCFLGGMVIGFVGYFVYAKFMK